MAFLMIEIDESERDFTRFFWDENPGIDLENKRLDIFQAVLACLRRFIARRSKPSVIWEDNATELQGSKKPLNEWKRNFLIQQNSAIQRGRGNRMELHSIRFSPFSGLWEENIKSMKRILLRVAKSDIMNFEELNYVDGTNRSSSEFTSVVSTFFGPQ
ncbi:integrase catalytic domain-containing protein [Trichonephila clavipes]|nr:integrase catalytic domain-containing protein [Trichonephila clavipes]